MIIVVICLMLLGVFTVGGGLLNLLMDQDDYVGPIIFGLVCIVIGINIPF